MEGELRLTITESQRSNVLGLFRRHNFGFPNFSSLSRIMIPFSPCAGPYVVIRYRLVIMDDPNDEIWTCEMTRTADGLSVVSIIEASN